jgi:hypothetical protein
MFALSMLHNYIYDATFHLSFSSGSTVDPNSGDGSNKYAKGYDGARIPRQLHMKREVGKARRRKWCKMRTGGS